MATLTAPEITYVRMMTGDDCPDYDVSDEFMQWLYDNRASIAPLCMSSDPLGGLLVWVMRARVAKAQKLFNEDGEDGARSLKQKRDHIKEDLERMERECGMGGSVVTIGTLDLGLDADCDTSQYTSRFGIWSWGGYL